MEKHHVCLSMLKSYSNIEYFFYNKHLSTGIREVLYLSLERISTKKSWVIILYQEKKFYESAHKAFFIIMETLKASQIKAILFLLTSTI